MVRSAEELRVARSTAGTRRPARDEVLFTMTQRTRNELSDETDADHGQVGPESAGQSGDTQGLSALAEAAGQSVEELAAGGQDYEAEVIEGVEDAADHPERPVRTRQDQSRLPELAPLNRSE